METAAIRDSLRNGHSKSLKRRRNVSLLSALGLVDFSIISLYQTGVIRHLPDLPFAVFDSDKVNASESAYSMGVPDGPVSLVTYALTMLLAAAGGSDETERKPIFDVALGGVVLGNAAGAAYYLYDMVTKQKKICLYCVTGALINFASVAMIAPVFFNSAKKMFGR
jgi:uncharacterized membrane protein